MTLTRNVLWNAVGTLLPILIGVAVVPLVVRHLGVERFGLLSAVWVLIGYFTIFDLGLSRTLTKLAADCLGSGRASEVAPLTSTTLIIVTGSGLALAIAVMLSGSLIARSVVGGNSALLGETSLAVRWVGVGLPFVLAATVLTGLLEAFQKFAIINTVRVPMGVATYLAPLAMLPFTNDIGVITAALALLRVVNATILARICLNTVPQLRANPLLFRRDLVRPLLTFGGWLTVSNIVGPLMVYADRFLIAAVLGSAAVAYYTVPYDVLTRLWVLPMAIQSVLFPAFVIMRTENAARLVKVFAKSSDVTLLLLAPATLATVLLAQEGLQLWVGAPFPDKSTFAAKILIIGVLVNAMARSPFALVQSAGRADWTALVHVIELPAYALLLWWSLGKFGIDGAACAWTARMAVDTLVFYVLAVKVEPRLRGVALRDVALLVLICLLALLLGSTLHDLFTKAVVVVLFGLGCGLLLLDRARDVLPLLQKRVAANASDAVTRGS